jgi:hypothetical protein
MLWHIHAIQLAECCTFSILITLALNYNIGTNLVVPEEIPNSLTTKVTWNSHDCVGTILSVTVSLSLH